MNDICEVANMLVYVLLLGICFSDSLKLSTSRKLPPTQTKSSTVHHQPASGGPCNSEVKSNSPNLSPLVASQAVKAPSVVEDLLAKVSLGFPVNTRNQVILTLQNRTVAVDAEEIDLYG